MIVLHLCTLPSQSNSERIQSFSASPGLQSSHLQPCPARTLKIMGCHCCPFPQFHPPYLDQSWASIGVLYWRIQQISQCEEQTLESYWTSYYFGTPTPKGRPSSLIPSKGGCPRLAPSFLTSGQPPILLEALFQVSSKSRTHYLGILCFPLVLLATILQTGDWWDLSLLCHWIWRGRL